MIFPVKKINLFGRIRPVLLDKYPFHVYISQDFYGMAIDYTSWGLKSHGGLDTPTPFREPCLGLGWGMVRRSYRQYGRTSGTDYGNVIIVWYPGLNLEVLYRHMDENIVKDGRYVEEGQALGYCGSTGISTANHLHWEFKKTDDQGNILNQDNGWKGAIDPTSFYKKSMRYIINSNEDQFILIDEISRAISIADNEELENLRADGLINDPLPMEVPEGYTIWPGVATHRLAGYFNLRLK